MNDLDMVFLTTWRALLQPRRAIPIAIVAVPLVSAQAFFGGGVPEVLIAVAIALAFVLLAPASWRVLFPTSRTPPPLPAVARLALFVLVGASVVGTLGIATASAVGIDESFLTASLSLVITLAFFLVGGWGLGRDIEFEVSLVKARERATLMEREAEHARLMALRNHLDPHFVFNTLNAIAEWCREDGEVAERAILQLSDILRAVLAGVKQSTWPLAKERHLVESLAALHLLRDPNLFELDIRAHAGVDDVMIPPLMLLPLVENAVKHGPAAGHRGKLSIAFASDAAGLRVIVENPGPFRGLRAGGEGVRMVQSRLALFTNDKGKLTLEEIPGPRTRATLVIPT